MPNSDAYFLLSKSKMLKQYHAISRLVDYTSYSFKTNPDVGMLLEKSSDSLLIVQSIKALDSIKDKRRVWFLAQALTNHDLEVLFRKGVGSFIVDNSPDLQILLAYARKHKQKINLMLRMKVKEYTTRTEKHYLYGMFSAEINSLVPKMRKIPNINKLGVHFHRKTENISEWSIKEELSEVLAETTLQNIDLIDIGGGFPVEYKNYSIETLPHIFKKITQARKWANSYGVKLMAEPGRFIAAPCIELHAKVIGIDKSTILINCSVYNSAMDTIVANIKLNVKGELSSGNKYLIKGCTPDSTDIFRYRVYLRNVRLGDSITFLNAGAYTYSTNFCSLEPLETVIAK